MWRIQDDLSEYIAIKDIRIGDKILQEYGAPERLKSIVYDVILLVAVYIVYEFLNCKL